MVVDDPVKGFFERPARQPVRGIVIPGWRVGKSWGQGHGQTKNRDQNRFGWRNWGTQAVPNCRLAITRQMNLGDTQSWGATNKVCTVRLALDRRP